MKKENQVCTFEQAEKLFHLGIKYDEPQYAYMLRLEEMRLVNVEEYNRRAAQYREPFIKETTHFPAFSVAELGVMLPDGWYTIPTSIVNENDRVFHTEFINKVGLGNMKERCIQKRHTLTHIKQKRKHVPQC